MGMVARLRSLWRGLVRRGEVEAGMVDEFRHHIELRTRDLVAGGMTAADAARQARLEFGHIEGHREDARASRGLRFFDRIGFSWLDVKLGMRMLVKHPGLTIVGGLGIAVGVAVSAGTFAVLYSYLDPTLPLEEGDRIVALENRDVEQNNEERRALFDFVAWRDGLRTVADLGAFRMVDRNLTVGDAAPELVEIAEMTAAGFEVARVPPLLGRYLLAEDERAGATPVLVLGHDVWEARFAGDPGIVGRQVRIGTALHVVVGVMPEGFGFPMHHQYWTALQPGRPEGPLEGPGIYVFGRLAPDVTMAEAQAELDVVGQRAAAAWPETHARLRPMVMPYTYSLTDVQEVTMAEVAGMQFTVTLLLLIIAVNVAVLFHARTATRRGEIAVRSALGAGRGRIIGQLFAEAFVLALVASGLGLLLAQVGMRFGYAILEAETGGAPFWSDYGLRPVTVAFTIGLAVLAAVIVGVVPALQATGRGLQSDLRQLNGGTGLRLGRTWTALIVAQVAIAVAAMPIAVHMGWTEIQGTATRPAYPVEDYAIATLLPDLPDAEGDAAIARAEPLGADLTEVLRRLHAVAGIRSASYSTNLPDRPGRIQFDGPDGEWLAVRATGIGPRFLETVNARTLVGRTFGSADFAAGAANVIVNRSFVRNMLRGGATVGRRIRHPLDPGGSDQPPQPGPWLTIVGVIDDLETNAVDADLVPPAVYYPVAPEQARYARLLLQAPGMTLATIAGRTREIVASVDPTLWLGGVRSYADLTRQEQSVLRLVTLATALVLISVFLLSAAGIYAMTSFTVTRRRREIGIRVALGADAARILRTVFSRAGTQIGLGIAFGVAAALALDYLAEGDMLGGRAAVLLPAFAASMALVAMLATLGPARRGLRIQPTEAIREE